MYFGLERNGSLRDVNSMNILKDVYKRQIINTFLEAYDFTGKDFVLFATSGGSGLGQTAADLSHSCPGAHIRNGKLLNGNPSEASLRQWVASL